jgi:chemotaxis protein MotB
MARSRSVPGEEVNPYIAFTDLMINFVLVLIFFLAALTLLGRIGWDEIRYRDIQEDVRKYFEESQIEDIIVYNAEKPNGEKIPLSRYRNDPPGAQRWAIYSAQLFQANKAQLTPDGEKKVRELAKVLIQHHNDAKVKHGNEWLKHTWRRVRIEGHTRPTQQGKREDWQLSAARAAAVANVLSGSGIPAWHIAVAARGGQTPFMRGIPPNDPRHERVEIILEYAAPR